MPLDFAELRAIYKEKAQAVGRRQAQRLVEAFTENLLECKKVSWKDFDVQEAFTALVPGGGSILRSLWNRSQGKARFQRLQEAGDAVNLGAFTNISGQFFINRIMEDYQKPTLLWPRLVNSQKTTEILGERNSRIGEIGDKFSDTVKEGDTYGRVGLTEEYTLHPALQKRGKIIDLTREVLISNRTGDLMRKAGYIGEWLGIREEKQVLTTVLGVTGCQQYRYMNQTAVDPYQATTPFANIQTGNALVNWRSVEAARLKQAALTDPVNGEPIMVESPMLLVPPALEDTARYIQNATAVEMVDNTAAANTVRTITGNPLAGRKLEILSNQYVRSIGGSDTTWWYGDFPKAFLRRYAWEIEVLQAAGDRDMKFERDIWASWKASVMAITSPEEPRYATKNTAA